MKRYLFWLLLIISGGLYISIGYHTDRTRFPFLFFQLSALFASLIGIWYAGRSNVFGKDTLRIYQWTAIVLRALLLFSIPNLSDDFYRFLWDGHLTNLEFNPYLIRPDLFKETASLSNLQNTLFNGLNSASYFTIYPPLNQYLFAISVGFFPYNLLGEIVVLKLFILSAEIITIFSLPRLLNLLKLRTDLSTLYLFNPLVIIESAGNLHFEVFTVCFLCLSFIFLLKSDWIKSSVLFGMAVSVKLIPLIILPIMIRYLGLKRGIIFSIISFIFFVILFIPFFDEQIVRNIFSSIELYFRSFEFNASIYYLIRYIGYQVKGYNIIQVAGLILALVTFTTIVVLFFRQKISDKKELLKFSFVALLVFYLLSTTIHPWYVINVLFFALLSGFHLSVLMWSYLVFLSYSAYMNSDYGENLYLVAFEYIIFLLLFSYELFKENRLRLTSTIH